MVDFNISHYLIDNIAYEYNPNRFDGVFYGNLEDKPKTEIELIQLQSQYLQTRDQSIWKEMFNICWSYMRSLILQKQRGKGFIEPEIVDDQTTSATLAFMSQYLTRPDFEVGASFAGMMQWKIVEVLYKNKERDGNPISLDMQVSAEGKATLEDLIAADEHTIFNPEEFVTKTSIYQVIEEVLKELDEELDQEENSLYLKTIVRLYIILCLRHPKNRHSKKMFMDHWAKDYKVEKLINYVMLEIKNRLQKQIY